MDRNRHASVLICDGIFQLAEFAFVGQNGGVMLRNEILCQLQQSPEVYLFGRFLNLLYVEWLKSELKSDITPLTIYEVKQLIRV